MAQGLRDLGSVAVQLFVLPFIASVCLGTPRKAAYLAAKTITHLDGNFSNKIPSPELSKDDFSYIPSRGVMGLALGIIAIPLSCARSLLEVPVQLLKGDKRGLTNAAKAMVCAVAEPILSVKRIFTVNSYSTLVNDAYRPSMGVSNRVFIYKHRLQSLKQVPLKTL